MSDLRQNLLNELKDPEFRYAYAQSFLNTKIAAQIKTLREQRGLKQAEVGALIGTPQSGYSRFEDVNHSAWKTGTLWKIAQALGVRVNISFETFGSLIDEKEGFGKESLQRPDFEHDPTFATKSYGPSSDQTVGRVTLLSGPYATNSLEVNYSSEMLAFGQTANLAFYRPRTILPSGGEAYGQR
jgi:transcriptional regulator with XRE-family HTH domain